MPGPYIHISSMKHIATALAQSREPYAPPRSPGDPPRIDPKWTGPNTRDLGNLMLNAPNFASLGAIGPDLFFALPDFRNVRGIPTSTVLVTILNFLKDLYNALDPYISKYEKYLGPISEDTAEEMSRLTGGLSEVVGNITGDLFDLKITAYITLVTELSDVLSFFSLGLDRGYDDQAFFWSDMLHYRDTGQFARAIWKRADAANGGDDQLRAYALGYQTHVATDVTGHAFVNAIAGGPFRTHWQRHHLVENHMDSFWYLGDAQSPAMAGQYTQLTESALYYDIAFDPDTFGAAIRPTYQTGGTLRDNYTRSRLLDLDSELPDKLAQLLIDAMGDVWYQNPNTSGNGHPKILSGDGRPTVKLVKEAYDLFYRYLKYVTLDGFHHEPPDMPDVFPNLQFPTISDPGSSAPGDSSDDGNLWDDIFDFFLAIIQVLSYLVQVAIYLATLPWAVLADLVTYPLRLGLYYALELPLFHLLKSFRSGLVMTGYMLPMDDEISPTLMTLGVTPVAAFAQLLGTLGDVFGGLLPAPPAAPAKPFRDLEYPHQIVFDSSNNTVEYRAPWAYPTSPVELHNVDLQNEALPPNPLLNSSGQLATTAGPYPAMATPAILFGGLHQDPALRDRFEQAATPGDADVVGMAVAPTAHLGDSVAFGKYLLWLETRDPVQGEGQQVPLVEWNLDSDLGYGYHCWDWNRGTGDPDKDPEGNSVQPPCVAPEQLDAEVFVNAKPNPWVAGTRLLVHWVGPGLQDPGCDGPPPQLG